MIKNGGGVTWAQLRGTMWEKAENHYVEFDSDDSCQYAAFTFFYPFNEGIKGESSSISSLSGCKITTTGNRYFSVTVAGNTLTISNWSTASEATLMNGAYTKKE
jgi:hypothetical protein